MVGGIEKRIDALAQRIGSRRARQIVVLVDGDQEDQSAAEALVQELGPGRNDLAIFLGRFTGDKSELPRIGSITNL
jgi:hypothetical protein